MQTSQHESTIYKVSAHEKLQLGLQIGFLYGCVGVEQVVVQLEWPEMTGTCAIQGRSPLPDLWSQNM